MELEKLKNTWSSLDERLKKQEVLKENIMKEMLHTKSDKALSRLMKYEIIGILVLLLVIPVIIYSFDLHLTLNGFKFFMYSLLAISIFFLLWQAIKIYGLMHIDFSKSISTNIQYTNRYNIQIKREKIVMLFVVPILILACFYFYVKLNANSFLWAFLICMSIGAVFYTIWSYKKLYDKNIASILKSLEELKELQDES